MDSRKSKFKIVIAIEIILLLAVCNAIGTNMAIKKQEQMAQGADVDKVEKMKNTMELKEFNTMKDYKAIIGDNNVTMFVEPKYIVKVDNNGISSLNSEENVVYYNDSDGNESFISIQYETTEDGIERQVIYGIKLNEENDKLALLKAEEVFNKIGYSEDLDMLDNAFNEAILKYDGQLGSFGLKRQYSNGVIRVGAAKKLLGNKINYQVSVGHRWNELKEAEFEKIRELEFITDSRNIIEEFKQGYDNIFDISVEPLIDLNVITDRAKSIMDIKYAEKSVTLNFNESGLAWISVKNKVYNESGNAIEVESRVLKSANNTITAYATVTSNNKSDKIGDIAIKLIDGLSKHKSEIGEAEKNENSYIKLNVDKNNSSLAILRKEDSVVFDLSQTYSTISDTVEE